MRRRFNFRLALALVVLTALFGGGLFGLQRWQARRQAAGLLDLARNAESQGKVDRAAQLISAYMKYSPDDATAMAWYGRLLEGQAKDPKSAQAAAGAYERSLTLDPAQADVRRRLSKLYLVQRRYGDALSLLKEAGAETASDAWLAAALAQCYEAQGNPSEAGVHYRRAIDLDPTVLEPYVQLILMLRKQGGPGGAAFQELVNRMVAANPQSPEALLTRARYQLVYKTGDGQADLAEAVRLSPTHLEARLISAEVAPLPETAKAHLEVAREHHPRDPRVYLSLAQVESRLGNPAKAVEVLRQAVARLPGNPQLLFGLAARTLEQGNAEEAERVVREIARWKLAPERRMLLEARLKVRAGDPRAALTVLQAARPNFTTDYQAYAAEADLLIARCHELLGENDLALAAYRRAADAGRAEASEGVARALIRSGRLDEATELYRRLAADPAATPGVVLTYARLRVSQYLSAPAAARQTAAATAILAEAEARIPNSVEVQLLRAEVLAADNKPDEAQKLLETQLAARPKAPELAVPLARLLARRDRRDQAQAVLAAASDEPVAVDILAAKAELAAPESLGELAKRVEARLATATPEEQLRLCVAMANAHGRARNPERVRHWWGEVAKRRPDDLGVRLQQFELAAQADDRPAMAATLQAVHQIEGAGGPVGHYLEAINLLLTPEGRTPGNLAKARDHLSSASLKRASWSAPVAARGTLAEAQGNPEEALSYYLRAIDLGDRRQGVVRRTVQLLCERQRYNEAERVVQRATPQGAASSQLNRLAAEVSVLSRQLERAVELAGVAVPANSTEAEEHLWQSEIYAAAGELPEAESAIRRAIAVSETRPEPWVALARHYARTGRGDKVDEVLTPLAERITGANLTLTRARCLEAVGKTEQAAAAYREAVASRPGDVETVRQLVGFQDRVGSPADSIPALRRLAESDLAKADAAWARRSLATGLAATTPRENFLEALKLLDVNLVTDPGNPVDTFAKARVAATRLTHQQQAVELLKDLDRRARLEPEAEFLLGQLLADRGDWPEGQRLMVNVLARVRNDVPRLKFFVDRVLQFGTPDDARPWVERLAREAPNEPATVALQTRWLAQGNRAADAVRLLAGLDPKPGLSPPTAADRGRLRQLATAAESAGFRVSASAGPLLDWAETKRRELAKSGDPADRLALAEHLARRGRVSESLELTKSTPPRETATTLLTAAYGLTEFTPEQLNAMEATFLRCLGGIPNRVEAASLRGLFEARQGRYAKAAELFRVVAAQGQPETLNNLAYMLVLSDGPPAEIEALLAKAIAQVGETAELLDTRGTGRLRAGRLNEAITDLERAVAQEPTAARCLHLAQAYERANRPDDARRLLKQAEQLRPDATLVMPAETAGLRELQAALNRQVAS